MGLSSRCGLLMAIGLSMGLARSGFSLGQAFHFAQLMGPPESKYPPYKERPYRNTAAYYNNVAHRPCPSGKAHCYAPPARPSKQKCCPRKAGRSYEF